MQRGFVYRKNWSSVAEIPVQTMMIMMYRLVHMNNSAYPLFWTEIRDMHTGKLEENLWLRPLHSAAV